MSKTIIPANYTPALNLYDTQRAIGTVKRLFADTLCATLNLYRVSAPLFVEARTGLNDDLNGVERQVTFDMPAVRHRRHRWCSRWPSGSARPCKDYGFRVGKGLYYRYERHPPGRGRWTTSTPSTWTSGTGRRSSGRRTATEAYLKSVVRRHRVRHLRHRR